MKNVQLFLRFVQISLERVNRLDSNFLEVFQREGAFYFH